MLAVVCAFAWLLNPTQADEQQPRGSGPNQTPPQPSISIAVTTPQNAPQELDAERKQREREIAIQEGIKSFNGMLVIVGALQVVAMIFGLAYTIRAANAAKSSADTAKQALVVTQSAHMSYRAVRLTPMGNLSPETKVSIIYKNSGSTPAYKFSVKSWMQVDVPGNAPRVDGPVGPLVTIPSNGEITHDITQTAFEAVGSNAETWALVERGELPFKIFSTATYEDIFTSSTGRVRHVNFEAVYDAKTHTFNLLRHESD